MTFARLPILLVPAILAVITLSTADARAKEARKPAQAGPELFATVLINSNEDIELKCKEYARMHGKSPNGVFGEKVENVGPAIRIKCYVGVRGGSSGGSGSSGGGYSGGGSGDYGGGSSNSASLPNGAGAWRNLDTLGTRVESRSVNGYDQPSALENKCRQEASSVPRATAYRANLESCVATPTSNGDYVQCRLRSCDFQVIR